jgi:Spx/MgsR family transcriptional regulator
MLTLYGIPNCDTVKKARAWLADKGLEYRFHDYKQQGIDAATLQRWCAAFGHDQVLNRRGTTWRKLSETQRASADQTGAIRLMQAQPSLIRRPVLDTGARLLLGFDEADWRSLL